MPQQKVKIYKKNQILLFVMHSFLVSGCVVGPNYKQPEIIVPTNWLTDSVPDSEVAMMVNTLEKWWLTFDDPILSELIQKANGKSLSLREALSRIDESRARLKATAGNAFPSVNGNGSVIRNRPSANASGVATLVELPTVTSYNLGLSSNWEIDFFGRIRRSVEEAKGRYEASIEEARSVLISLYADCASSYIDYRTFQHRIELAETNLRLQTSIRNIVAERVKAGESPELDLAQAESNVYTTKASLPSLTNGLVLSVNRLSVLLGLAPGSLTQQLSTPAQIPQAPNNIAISIPADVLRQRPDIRRSERLLAAQTSKIGIATTDLYPQLSLTGSFSFLSLSTGSLLKSASRGFDFGPTLKWKLFQGGAIRAQIKEEEARTEIALVTYENTLLTTFEEIENALSGYAAEKHRLEALKHAMEFTSRSAKLAANLYTSGARDFQSVLDSQRNLVISQDQCAISRGNLAKQLVLLYHALGGGWSEDSLTLIRAEINKEHKM